ncbi:MAG: transposase [Candidatus Eisenbacteria bacterium]|nr:transposase [Candidatus Eisenbacteria bacterium]
MTSAARCRMEPPEERTDAECDDRLVLNGILWILRTGAHWRDVPEWYPSPATCLRRHQGWSRTGVFNRILTASAEDLCRRTAVLNYLGFVPLGCIVILLRRCS